MALPLPSHAPLADDAEREPLLHRHSSRVRSGVEDTAIREQGPLDKTYEIDVRKEVGVLLRYSGPLAFTYLLQYTFSLVTVLVASQLSTDELAGVSLGFTTANIIGYAIFEGMATALDTLCSQAYGAGDLKGVGMHTIRFTIFVHLVAIPIGLLWIFSEPLLAMLVPSEALAEHAGSFLRYSLIGVPGYATFEAGKRFMQAQGNFSAGLVALIVCLPINVALTYLLVISADMRVAGAALAASLTNLARPLLLALYALLIDRKTLQCWPSLAEIRKWNYDWTRMVSLAIPGALMTLSEWLAFEIIVFCTSYVGNASLAAQTFLSSAAVLVWHISFSASIACSTRIGQLVGAGHAHATVKLANWYAGFFTILGIFSTGLTAGLIMLMLRFLVHDADVAATVWTAMPYAALFEFFDTTTCWVHGVVRGYGWQSLGAWVTVLVNYLFAVPLSLFLELGPPKMGISGLWIGLGSGLAVVTVVEAVVVRMRLRKSMFAGPSSTRSEP